MGSILRPEVDSETGLVNAMLVATGQMPPANDPGVSLWTSKLGESAKERLYPARQVWVHVDYRDYRNTYIQFGMPEIPPDYFLDHVQNRKAVRNR